MRAFKKSNILHLNILCESSSYTDLINGFWEQDWYKKNTTVTIATTDKGEQLRIIRKYKRYTEGHGKNIMQLLFVECTTLFLWPCVTCINNICKLKSHWYLHKNIIIWIFTHRLQEIQKVWTNCTVCLSCNPRFWTQIFVSLETRPAILVDVYNINLLIVVAKYNK